MTVDKVSVHPSALSLHVTPERDPPFVTCLLSQPLLSFLKSSSRTWNCFLSVELILTLAGCGSGQSGACLSLACPVVGAQ